MQKEIILYVLVKSVGYLLTGIVVTVYVCIKLHKTGKSVSYLNVVSTCYDAVRQTDIHFLLTAQKIRQY